MVTVYLSAVMHDAKSNIFVCNNTISHNDNATITLRGWRGIPARVFKFRPLMTNFLIESLTLYLN